MFAEDKILIVDVDGTLCPIKHKGQSYADLAPDQAFVARLRTYAADGWRIVIHSSRNMRSYQGNLGLINANTLPVLIDWLKRHDIPFHEVYMGKPWPGHRGFYVDDRAVRPREFLDHSLDELDALCARDRHVAPEGAQ